MKILADNISKKFLKQALFSNFTYSFELGNRYGIIGNNGSGKSTLLKIISGFLSPNTGSIRYLAGEREIPIEEVYAYVAYCAPYIDLIESMTMDEMIDFHFKFKQFALGVNKELFFNTIDIDPHKKIETYSSGMKQRLKIGLNLMSESRILLIDEPTSFLDSHGIEWFHRVLNQYSANKILIIASNDKNDLTTCREIINIENHKFN